MVAASFRQLAALVILMCSQTAIAVPLGRDHVMLQASFEKSKTNSVKKGPALDDFDDEDDEPADLDGLCSNFGCREGQAINIVSKSAPQKMYAPKPTLSKVMSSGMPSGSDTAAGTSRLQKGTKMSKVVLTLEEDD